MTAAAHASERASKRRRLPWAGARELYRLLCDGAPPRRFNVSRGPCMRDARTRRPFQDSYVDAGTWRPAREWDGTECRNRTLSVADLAQHLAGTWDVAVEAPSWSSCLVFDIDRHLPWMHEHLPREVQEATRQRDATLTALWRALGFSASKQPVILQTPRGGYHVYLPLVWEAPPGTESRWPNAAMRRHVEHVLRREGIELKPGVLELYPSGVPLRAPCGRSTLLVYATRPDEPERLGLELVPGTFRGAADRGDLTSARGDLPFAGMELEPQFQARRNVRGQITAFISALEGARRPLGEWLGTDAPLWDSQWGPFGSRISAGDRSTQPVSPTNSRCSPPEGGLRRVERDGWLLRGPAFFERVRDLLENGITHPGGRHDAALKLAFYWGAVRALPPFEVLARLNAWLQSHPHRSRLRDMSPARFVHETVAEAWHYYRHHVVHCVGRAAATADGRPGVGRLQAVDEAVFLDEVPADVWPGVRAFLGFLARLAGEDGVVGQPVEMSYRFLIALCGDRRVWRGGQRRRLYRVALDELQRLGVLTLHRGYQVGMRGREFSVWYRFGAGELPQLTREGDRLVGVRAVSTGVLCALARADGTLRLVLECKRQVQEAIEPGSWWVRMFAARLFTVGEFLHARPDKAVPGPWSWRRVRPETRIEPAVSCRAPPVEEGEELEETQLRLPLR
jgi:hypothetical protein